MERRGGCCIAMYGGGDAEAAWKVGRIMLRFRPIAPKPAAGSPAPPATEAMAAAPRRPKRKGNRNPAGRPRGRKPRKLEANPSRPKDDAKTSTSSSSSTAAATTATSSSIVTLPLMPETPERKDEPAEAAKESPPFSDSYPSPARVVPAWMGWAEGAAAAPPPPLPPRAVQSWVTVECVTDTWREGEVSWRSDEAVRAALAADECPGFVSDEWGRVAWSNEAYRRMVASAGAGEGGGWAEEEEELQVGLVAPPGLVPAACRAFTCRVRVRYARLPRGTKGSVAAPCDVWRLDGGGWAWRLDVKAALSLGL